MHAAPSRLFRTYFNHPFLSVVTSDLSSENLPNVFLDLFYRQQPGVLLGRMDGCILLYLFP